MKSRNLRTVAGIGSGAAKSHQRPKTEPIQTARTEGGICCNDEHDGAVVQITIISQGELVPVGVGAQFSANRRPIDCHVSAILFAQYSDGIASE